MCYIILRDDSQYIRQDLVITHLESTRGWGGRGCQENLIGTHSSLLKHERFRNQYLTHV